MKGPAALGVLYAEDFDVAPGMPAGGVDEPEFVAPAYTLADFDRAREAAVMAGRAEAAAGAEVAALQERTAALQAIAGGLQAGTHAVAAEIASATQTLAATVLSLLSAALPSLMDGAARREVTGLLHRLLPGLYGEPRIVVRLHPLVNAELERDLARLEPEDRARIVLAPTDALAPGDLRVAWQDGSFVRDTRALHAAAQAIIAGLGEPSHAA